MPLFPAAQIATNLCASSCSLIMPSIPVYGVIPIPVVPFATHSQRRLNPPSPSPYSGFSIPPHDLMPPSLPPLSLLPLPLLLVLSSRGVSTTNRKITRKKARYISSFIAIFTILLKYTEGLRGAKTGVTAQYSHQMREE